MGMYHYGYGGSHKSTGLEGEAAQTTDRVLVFLIDIRVSSIPPAERRWHCWANPFGAGSYTTSGGVHFPSVPYWDDKCSRASL